MFLCILIYDVHDSFLLLTSDFQPLASCLNIYNPRPAFRNPKSIPSPIIHHKRIETQGLVAVGTGGYEAGGVEGFGGEFQAGGILRRKARIPCYPCNRIKYFLFYHKTFPAPLAKGSNVIIPFPLFTFNSVKPDTYWGNNSQGWVKRTDWVK